MNDEEIIKKLSKDFNITLDKIDSYSWDEVGYVVNSKGRVEVLNLHSQNIKNLPKYINDLSELKILHLVGNMIESIKNIKNLKKLEILVIQHNQIKNISILEELKSLRELYLSHNPIYDLKPIEGLNNIRKLFIMDTLVIDCSPINSLINLEELYLGDNEVKNPKFLLNCRKLVELSIDSNIITDAVLTDQIYDCIQKLNLNILRISGFESIKIDRIVEFSQLKSLSITLCNLKDIEMISKMKLLQELNLSYNDIEDIQELSKLNLLQRLNLSRTFVKDISPLKNLRFLKYLNLNNTLIKDLKPLLGFEMKFVHDEKDIQYKSSQNEILICNCNDITNPPIEIVRQGNEAIRRYFKKIKEEGLDYIYEAKLILVGEGSAGKTSLQRRLVNENSQLPEGDSRTRGIEVVDFEFGKGKGIQSKKVHIWDFGGQDVYYPVHRFFITENSVFVLLASTRQPFHNFDYWIPTIFQFGGKSPIIIGQTCHQGNTAPWNEIDIYLSNPNFNIIKTLDTPYYRIDLPNNNMGLSLIKSCILNQIENLHHFGKGVPKSWLTIRNVLIKESKLMACIPFQSFVDLCRKSESQSFENILDVEDCCQFFHDIGVILWYSQIEELRDWVILDPEWAMNAVYKIIDDRDIQERNGVIHPSDFNRLWNNKSYEGKHSILRKMLITFKIAFPTKHSQGNYIMPARLNSIPNEKKWGLEERCLRLEYKFEFMPRGIVNQLSAELSRYILNYEVWNNAVNLAYNDSNTKSQIIEDSYNRKLSVVSKGIDARGINILIMNSMRNIIESYKGVKEEIYVKCPCSICQKLELPTMFLYTKLLEWSSKREDATATCNESGVQLKISELLYNIGFTGSKSENSQTKNKIITIFLASSKELENDRKEFEIFINRENKQLLDDGIFIKLEIWEDFIDQMSKTRLQDEYNKAVMNSDIFISLFWTKVGEYSSEEFNKAWNSFTNKGKPYIYTYFKNALINPTEIRKEDINSKFKFLAELKELGHYPTNYENIEDLKYKFKMQLQKILPSLI